jgi:hypothetical protein
VVTGRPQAFGERPDARAEVDQILWFRWFADQAG